MKKIKRTLLFIFDDYFFSLLSWIVFYFSRKIYIEKTELIIDIQFFKGIVFIPIFWVLIFTIQGTYVDIKRSYRSKIFNQTFIGTILGTCILFFMILLDDKIKSYQSYYESISILFVSQFAFILFSRLIFITIQVKRIQNKKDYFNTMIIGSVDQINSFEKELNGIKKSIGNKIVSHLDTQKTAKEIPDSDKQLVEFENLDKEINKNEIEEVIIIDNEIQSKKLQYLLAKLSGLGVLVKIKASDFDIAIGTIKQNNLFGLLIREIQFDPMPYWQKSIKRILDLTISIISLLFLTPFFILIAIIIKRTSKGPIFFKQERVGKHSKPFNIIKFRTMYLDSEKNGPQLSSSNDTRITKFGKFLRKTRIDEFPQFVNVIKGEMSLVGPRPERRYYIDEISEKEPSFLQLTLVKPGISSWGQVKYGYAENVDQMIQRIRFDLLYLKNRSLVLDFKIMFYTLITVLKAKGK